MTSNNYSPASSMFSDEKAIATDEKHLENVETQVQQRSSPVDTKAQKVLLRKLDAVLLPLLSCSYLLAYMDRNNVGNARLMGLQKGLGLSDGQFYNIVMVFYAGYISAIFPANLLLRKIGPRSQLGGAVMLFGVFVCCMCAAKDYASLIGLRFAVGVAEALLQSTPLYMAAWYGRHELGKRIAFFYSATTISGVFSGFISYGVQNNLEGKNGLPSWKWLFLIEGVLAIGFGFANFAFLPTFPDRMRKSYLLSEHEIEIAKQRNAATDQSSSRLATRQIFLSLKDPKTWLIGIVAGINSLLLAATGAFLPTIVKAFGFSSVQAQLFTVIPYACAFFSMIIIGYLSDRCRTKSYFLLGALTSCAIGLIILLSTSGKEIGIFATCLLVGGAYPAAVLQISWTQIMFAGYTKRAISWGVSMVLGQGLSMAAAQMYTDAPRFTRGHSIVLALVIVSMISTVALRFVMIKANKTRDLEVKPYDERGQAHPDDDKTYEDLCDKHIRFRYPL